MLVNRNEPVIRDTTIDFTGYTNGHKRLSLCLAEFAPKNLSESKDIPMSAINFGKFQDILIKDCGFDVKKDKLTFPKWGQKTEFIQITSDSGLRGAITEMWKNTSSSSLQMFIKPLK